MCSLKRDLPSVDCAFLCKFKYLRTQLKKQNLHIYIYIYIYIDRRFLCICEKFENMQKYINITRNTQSIIIIIIL